MKKYIGIIVWVIASAIWIYVLTILPWGPTVQIAEGAEGDRYYIKNYEPVLVVAVIKELDYGTTRYSWTAWDTDLDSTWVRWSTPTYATVSGTQNAWLTWRQRHRPNVAYQYVYPHRIKQNFTETWGDPSYTEYYDTVEWMERAPE